MTSETFENSENIPSLTKRKEEVFQAFIADLQDLESIDQLDQKLNNATASLGELQAEATKNEQEFSVVSDVSGFEISELSDYIKRYYAAKADQATIDSFTSERKREEIDAAVAELTKSLPEEITVPVDRLVEAKFATEATE